MSNPGTPAQTANQSAEEWTVQRILTWTTEHLRKQGIESPRLESEILLAHARKCQRIELYTHFNEIVKPEVRTRMRELVQRRSQREPVAYLVGHKEFYSLDFLVEQGVFIPRPETESLVMKAIELLKSHPVPSILELCTGSGCIPISLVKQLPRATATTIELHDRPYEVAQQNAKRHQVDQRIRFLKGDLFSPLETKNHASFDLLISNPPYVTSEEVPALAPEIARHEPVSALDGGPDGLDPIRIILNQGASFLKAEGYLLLEMDPKQIPAAVNYAEDAGHWAEIGSFADDFGKDRFLIAQKLPQPDRGP